MKKTVAKGFFWVSGSMALVRGARYLAFFVIAGVLSPADFGHFAELVVVVIGLTLMQGFGIGQALIFRKERVDEAADTLFFISLALGVLFFLAAWTGAPLVERFYNHDGLTGPFRLYSVFLICRAFQTVPVRLFEKNLQFRKKLVPGLIGSLLYAATTIFLAFRGAGLWALVAGEAIGAVGETVTYWIISPWKPRLRFVPSIAKEDLRFGWAILGGTVLIFLFQGIDRVAISRLLGPDRLGFYAFAYTIASLPETFFIRAFNTVLLPSYTSDTLDRKKRKELFFRATSYGGAMGIIFVIGVVLFGAYFLEAAYGEKWLPALPSLYILAFLGLFRALSALSEDLIVGLGRPSIFRVLCGFRLILALAALYFGIVKGGITGVAIVMTSATFLTFLAGWETVRRLLGASPSDFVRALSGPLVAGAAAVLLSLLAHQVLPGKPSLPAVLLAGAIVFSFFMVLWFLIDHEARNEWWRWIEKKRADRFAHGPKA